MSTLDELIKETLELDERAARFQFKEMTCGLPTTELDNDSYSAPICLGTLKEMCGAIENYRTSAPLLAKACLKMKEALIKIGIKSHDEFMQTNGIIEHEQILFRRGQTAREALADVDALLKGEK